MAEQPNVEHIKEALVSSGVLKAATISEAEREKIQKALATKGVKAPEIFIICSTAHYCIVIKRD
jgi:hypothetical protein